MNSKISYNVIGITGRKYNGKDTIGKLFVDEFGFTQLAYADPLKDVCKNIFGFDNDQLYGNKKEVVDDFWKVTPRKVLQFVGTNLFREQTHQVIPHVGKDLWVQVMKKKILDGLKNNPTAKFVVTDVRFQNEADLIKELGGIVIRVTRDSVNDYIDSHQSESMIDGLNVDCDVKNNGTIEELYNNVKKCVF